MIPSSRSPEIRAISERMKASLSEIVFSLPNTLPGDTAAPADGAGEETDNPDLLALKVELVIVLAEIKAERRRNQALGDQLDVLGTRFGALGSRLEDCAVIESSLAAERSRIDELRTERDRWLARAERLLAPQVQPRRGLLDWIGKSRDLAPA